MNNQTLEHEPYIQRIIALNEQLDERYAFHKAVEPILLEIGSDNAFLRRVIRRNFDDPGYLSQTWSLYNIPYFHVYENDDFILKIHIFPAGKDWEPGIAAHAIHHHNNYILTTNAFFGSGYESLLFDPQVQTDPKTLRTRMKITRQFHQKDWNPSRVDSWVPHIVFLPEQLSATLLIWTPEKKRATDKLRSNPLLKAVKGPLRKIIQLLGMESVFGIAKAHTYQYYAAADGKGFMAIEEEKYFAPTKAANGEDVQEISRQLLFSFIQKANLADPDYFRELAARADFPEGYRKWVNVINSGETIEEIYHTREINIPQGSYTLADIQNAAKY
ncbi:MAG: hypothetical protein JNL57_00885 [Bacteroidetes bacterium]|nr:hypothetical protein [Bacteroidota bacterium]